MPKPIHDPFSKKLDQNSRIEVKNTTCYMCACRCGIRVTLRDAEVRYIQGNPDQPLNKGVICATGRDQMQALTGLFAKQFGTPELDRAKLFVMVGTAEDHHSNPTRLPARPAGMIR